MKGVLEGSMTSIDLKSFRHSESTHNFQVKGDAE